MNGNSLNDLDQLRGGALIGARQVKLACGLKEFPRELFGLADTLEVLDLSGNALTTLPEDLPRLRNLRILFCSNNQFVRLPDVLGQCEQLSIIGFKTNRIRTIPAAALPTHLRWLILTDNQIEALPDEIGLCSQLQKLMLAGNRLQRLPASLAGCSRLELLRIAANAFFQLPDWLLELPRLSWLAYAGNPMCHADEAKVMAYPLVSNIDWARLQIFERLGEGASGVIYQATDQQEKNSRQVAVKLFKGAVTSDGWPSSEMAACLHAGLHEQLIPVLGRIAHHPDGINGLVMPLIEPEYSNLAGPPNLETCTRDVYAQGKRFSAGVALRIARGIASAVRHLHQRGIMHGDLYAHNILHCDGGGVLLGDFGAASFLPQEDPARTRRLQALEVRAFGCLLEELSERIETDQASCLEVACFLARLADSCLSADISDRPNFEAIEQALSSLSATSHV